MERPHHRVVVVGGGQAGLSTSRQLSVRGITHRVFERERVAHAWRTQRWDSFCLVTPNWQCRLPDFPYAGSEPDGFMGRDAVVEYIEAFARHVAAPVAEGVAVERVRSTAGGFALETSEGPCTADAVVMAMSAYHRPAIPAMAQALPPSIAQIHSSAYRNPAQLPAGAVLVVGSGQSGCQIAEDLHLEGREVHLVTGSAPRAPRSYRGREGVAWLDDMGQYAMTVEQHPLGDGVRPQRQPLPHRARGRPRHRPARLRAPGDAPLRPAEGDRGDRPRPRRRPRKEPRPGGRGLCRHPGRDRSPHRGAWHRCARAGALSAGLASSCARETQLLDLAQAGIGSVVWATGFRPDFSLIEADILDARGMPEHRRGVSPVPGLYFVGLPWLWTWGSGRFSGIAADSAYVADHVIDHLRSVRAERGAA